ncbi:MAG TPA: pirin family protein [Pseudomonadales bacterium]|nr:pirin family protein [Pseudomonadales bacterium]
MAGNPTSNIEAVVIPRVSDLGDGFAVRRALPSAQRRAVGPFVFLDEMGPTTFQPGHGLDVRPHPHIGLATVTYLFEGEILHRDSLGNELPIRPGELNWMTAGAGIVHSERTPTTLRQTGSRLFGVQAWVALPIQHEETAPAFSHYTADQLPVVGEEGLQVRVIAGALFGARSPVQTHSNLFYAEVNMTPGTCLTVTPDYLERAAFLVEGEVIVNGEENVFQPGQLLVFRQDTVITLQAKSEPVRLMLLGGDPLDAPRHIWWNFVSSTRQRLDQAKADWKTGKFAKVPGETEFIPLPD